MSMEMQKRKTNIPETADTLARTNRPAVSSQADNTIEIQLDTKLVDALEEVIGPMGWTVEEYIQAVVDSFTEYIIDPVNKEKVAELVAQWRSESLLSAEKEYQKALLKTALLQFDPSLTEASADYIVLEICENVDFTDPNIARHSLQWIAEKFYTSHYLHAGWNDFEEA